MHRRAIYLACPTGGKDPIRRTSFRSVKSTFCSRSQISGKQRDARDLRLSRGDSAREAGSNSRSPRHDGPHHIAQPCFISTAPAVPLPSWAPWRVPGAYRVRSAPPILLERSASFPPLAIRIIFSFSNITSFRPFLPPSLVFMGVRFARSVCSASLRTVVINNSQYGNGKPQLETLVSWLRPYRAHLEQNLIKASIICLSHLLSELIL